MKVVIINKSDSTGGAAVVSFRLMQALRQTGIDAQMIVCEKKTSSPFVHLAAPDSLIRRKFILERLKIFIANGFNRKTLFKIDTAQEGLPLWKNPLVINADAILLNWVNQGMLSIKGVKKLLKLEKPVIWTMHDMWEMTGICHHAGTCHRYLNNCGECPLLETRKGTHDLSYKIWKKKNKLYNSPELPPISFVSVSKWLKDKALLSSLLSGQKVEVIPNAFKVETGLPELATENPPSGKIRILFGAARLDDPIKGLPDLKLASAILRDKFPEMAGNMEFVLFGNVKDPDALKGFALPMNYLGVINESKLPSLYINNEIVVSASSYETLPGTLVEAQAYGCIPVSFNQGGQNDIIDHLSTGFLAQYLPSSEARALNLAEGIVWAALTLQDSAKTREIKSKMLQNVKEKFSFEKVANKYIQLINDRLQSNR